MTVGFFLVVDTAVVHFLHAASLVRELARWMPGVEIVQLSNRETPMVPGVTRVARRPSAAPLLEQRLTHYASLPGEWLLVDTDVSVRADVRDVFADPVFDVALCDRQWPHSPQGEALLQTMPFNTGVVFSRQPEFWADVLATWRRFDDPIRADWMSEQRAVYDVVRMGRYRIKILPGLDFNYPPNALDDAPPTAKLLHFKGPRKRWLSQHATQVLAS